jgi:hypothetical protein
MDKVELSLNQSPALTVIERSRNVQNQGTGQIDVGIHPKKRMPTAQVADFQ